MRKHPVPSIFLIICILLVGVSCATTAVQSSEHPYLFKDRLQGKVFDRTGNEVAVDADYYLIYYAADWCPYCQSYAEDIKSTYEYLKRMYGNVEIVFAGHKRDVSNDNLIAFMEQGSYPFPYVKYEFRQETGIMEVVDMTSFLIPGFVLVDRTGGVLSSSQGPTKDDYSRDRPINYLHTVQQCDCVSEPDWSVRK